MTKSKLIPQQRNCNQFSASRLPLKRDLPGDLPLPGHLQEVGNQPLLGSLIPRNIEKIEQVPNKDGKFESLSNSIASFAFLNYIRFLCMLVMALLPLCVDSLKFIFEIKNTI